LFARPEHPSLFVIVNVTDGHDWRRELNTLIPGSFPSRAFYKFGRVRSGWLMPQDAYNVHSLPNTEYFPSDLSRHCIVPI
jgi:hypothetical protein